MNMGDVIRMNRMHCGLTQEEKFNIADSRCF